MGVISISVKESFEPFILIRVVSLNIAAIGSSGIGKFKRILGIGGAFEMGGGGAGCLRLSLPSLLSSGGAGGLNEGGFMWRTFGLMGLGLIILLEEGWGVGFRS